MTQLRLSVVIPAYQGAPAGVGQPTLLINGLTVGVRKRKLRIILSRTI